MALIYLYDSHVKDFTYNGHPLPKAYDVVVKHFLNDEYYVTWKHAIDKEEAYKNIQKDKIITAHTPTGMQPFRIMDPVKTMDYVEFEAWPLFFADMRNKLIRPLSLTNATGQQAISAFVSNLLLDTPFEFTTNVTERHDYHTQTVDERENDLNQLYDALEIFKALVKRWNAELIINGYDIRLVNRVGEEKQALLYEKKNIISYIDRESISGIVTRVYGKSEWTETSDGEEITDHSIQTSIDSPLIDSYNGIIFERQYTNNDLRSEQELIEWLNLKFTTENIDKPSRNVELDTNIIQSEEVHLGDGLVLKYLKHDADMHIRMIGYDYDGYADRYIKTYLGDAKDSFTGAVSNTVTNVESNAKQQSEKIAHVILNRQGVKVIYSPFRPAGDFRNNDIWFDEEGGMFKYDNELADWIPHPYNRRMDIAKQAIEEQQQDIQETKESSDRANQQINDAISNAGFSTLTDLTADLISVSDTALSNAQSAISRVIDAERLASNALSNAQDALFDANDAVMVAQDASSLATTLSGQVSDFEITVNGFTQLVNNYEGQVAQFTSDVNGLNSTVASFETVLDSYGNEVANYATQVSQFENTVNGLNSTVSSYQSDVQGYEAQVSTLTNTVNGFNATVQRVEADYSGLSGTVQNLGASIGVVEGQITNRVWQTDIQTAVDDIEVGGRNYLRNSDFSSGDSYWSGGGNIVEGGILLEGISGPSSLIHNVTEVPEGEYILQVWYEVLEGQAPYLFNNGSSDAQASDYYPFKVDKEYFEVGMTIRASNLMPSFRYAGGTPANHLVGKTLIKRVKLEKGNKATDWTPAPEDTLQLISNVETEWKQTALGFEQSITRVEAGLDGKASLVAFNTLTSTVDGTIQRIGDAEGNITQIEANVSGLQTTVASKASQTEVTQLATGFNVLSTNFNNLEIGGRNLARGTINSNFLIGENRSNQFRTMYARVSSEPLEAGTDYVVSFKYVISNSSNPSGTFRIQGSNPYPSVLPTTSIASLGERGYLSAVFRLASGSTTFSGFQFRFDNFTSGARFEVSEFKLEKGNKATDWTPAPEDMASQAQLSVLNDQINLRVKEGDVMSQINIEAGRTLIDTDRLYLSANTTVFGGSAFIPNAAIESLSADKLTAGEIDASKINVINMDASAITAGTISGANMFLNLNEGVFTTTSSVSNQLAGIMTINYGRLESFSNIGTARKLILSGDQLHMEDADGFVQLTPRYIDFRANNRTARLRFNGTNFVYDTNVGLYGNHINSVSWLGLNSSTTHLQSHPTQSGSALVDGSRLALGNGTRDNFEDIMVITAGLINGYKNLNMRDNWVEGVQRLVLHSSTTELLTASDNASGVLRSGQQLIIGIRTGSAVHNTSARISIGGRIDMHRNTWMNGNTLYGQIGNESDRRLKDYIEDTAQNSLSIINRLNFVEYEWIDKDTYGPGKQFGLIAQDVDQSLVLHDQKSDIYSINSSRLTLVNAHAIQQLSQLHENNNKIASAALIKAEDVECDLEKANKKIKILEEKVERLEGAA